MPATPCSVPAIPTVLGTTNGQCLLLALQNDSLQGRKAARDAALALAAWRAAAHWKRRARFGVAQALSGAAMRSLASSFQEWAAWAGWQVRP